MKKSNGNKARKVLIVLIAMLFVTVVFSNSEVPSDSLDSISENIDSDLNETVDTVEETKEESVSESTEDQEVQTTEEQTYALYDGNGIKIDATGFESLKKNETIKLHISNSSNLNLGVAPYAYAINGVMAGGGQYGVGAIDVSSGKEANSVIDFNSSIFEEGFFDRYAIDSINNFDILFWAYDNDESFKAFDTGQIHINFAENHTELPKELHGTTVYDQNGIKVDLIEKDGNSFTCCITNNTGKYITYTAENINFDDMSSSDTYYDIYDEYLLNGCSDIFSIEPTQDFLEVNTISDVSKLDFSLNINPLGGCENEWKTDLITIQ